MPRLLAGLRDCPPEGDEFLRIIIKIPDRIDQEGLFRGGELG
jgi:hypothetical protein